jgi:hypothetical protein
MNCAVPGCKDLAIAMWHDGKWRCHVHHKELSDALAREVELAERRKRLEEQFCVALVMHLHTNKWPVNDDDLRSCREAAKRYASHLVDA